MIESHLDYQPDKMPDQWLYLMRDQIIRLDTFTEDNGQPNYRGIMLKYDISSPVLAINLHTALRKSIERRVKDAFAYGRANEMLGVVSRTTKAIESSKAESGEPWSTDL